MNILKYLSLILFVVTTSCESSFVSYNKVPSDFIGNYVEISDDVVDGLKYPDTLKIFKSRIVYTYGNFVDLVSAEGENLGALFENIDSLNRIVDQFDSSKVFFDLPINKVNQKKKTTKSILIFCGAPNEEYGSKKRYQLTFFEDLLIVEEIEPQEEMDEVTLVGKFKKINENS